MDQWARKMCFFTIQLQDGKEFLYRMMWNWVRVFMTD